MSSSAVLNIDNLSLEFPAYRSNVQALNGVSLHVNPGGNRRRRRRIRLGQVGDRHAQPAAAARAQLPHHLRQPEPAGPRHARHPGKQLLQIRGRDAAMIFQEPMTALNPTRRIGRQMLDVIIHHQRLSQDEARAKAIDLLRDMHIADPDAGAAGLPLRAVRWHAPAGDDSPGVFLRPAVADRR